jgi:5-methylcytosine-specific restriction endonuclease McrA
LRICRVCGKLNVETQTGPPTCHECSRKKYLIVKKRYQQSAKGQATTRAREERPDVKLKRCLASSSPQGRKNKEKYEATEKGKATRSKALKKYRHTEKGKLNSQLNDKKRQNKPERTTNQREYHHRYRHTVKGRMANARRDARRRGWLTTTGHPLTAEEWLEILEINHHRCYYCKAKTKLTIDHVIPLSKGGEHTKENIVPACPTCNFKKNDKIVMLL